MTKKVLCQAFFVSINHLCKLGAIGWMKPVGNPVLNDNLVLEKPKEIIKILRYLGVTSDATIRA